MIKRVIEVSIFFTATALALPCLAAVPETPPYISQSLRNFCGGGSSTEYTVTEYTADYVNDRSALYMPGKDNTFFMVGQAGSCYTGHLGKSSLSCFENGAR
jgi:hypothetical protein